MKKYFKHLLTVALLLTLFISCKDDEPTPITEPPVFAMDENYEITATCANAYKAYVNGIETILPYTITQTYNQQTIVVSGYGYGINLQNSDTVEQTFVVPAFEVDLGLPSGTLWATCNVGANAPEDYGYYFAWGETAPKDWYSWGTYKWCNGNYDMLTKYCAVPYYGYNDFTDDKTELDPEDDAAYVNWGPQWRMPTIEQQLELDEQCTWTQTSRNGVNGMLVKGPNGNTIFLPAAGRWLDSLDAVGSVGYYWSRTLFAEYSDLAYYLVFLRTVSTGCDYRIYGKAVRAVRVSKN